MLYLDARRFSDAAAALDRVPSASRDYPMALFKRAQVSVLLHEPDQEARIEAARRRADATTRPLVDSEKLFQAGDRRKPSQEEGRKESNQEDQSLGKPNSNRKPV